MGLKSFNLFAQVLIKLPSKNLLMLFSGKKYILKALKTVFWWRTLERLWPEYGVRANVAVGKTVAQRRVTRQRENSNRGVHKILMPKHVQDKTAPLTVTPACVA